MTIKDSTNDWPFPVITEASREPDTWVRVSPDFADEMLTALPPIYIPGGFMVGEPARHDETGAIYTAIVKVAGQHYARDVRYTERLTAHELASRATRAGDVCDNCRATLSPLC